MFSARFIGKRAWSYSLFCVAILLPLTGCARMAVFSDPELKHRTAVRVYSSTPYLLVARSDEDKPAEVSIVHLPDLERPQFIRFYSGLGSQDSSLAMTNGVLTSLGFKSDSKIPETIGAIAGLAKDVAGIRGTPDPTKGYAPSFQLYKFVVGGKGQVKLVLVDIDCSPEVPDDSR